MNALYSGTWTFTQFVIFNSSICGVIYYGAILYEEGEITIGGISSFILYLMTFMLMTLVFGMSLEMFSKMTGASTKIINIQKHVPIVNNQLPGVVLDEKQSNGEIELKNVHFTYPSKKDAKVLNNVSLTVGQNQVVALVGPSGCGKSSIISLIQRFYDVDEGEVLYGGTNIKDLNSKWYKQQVSIVQQEPILFTGTIRENIMYGLDKD